MRILLITSDAFGAHGGIAQYNRDLLTALTSIPEVDEVVALPRNLRFSPDVLPAKLRFHDAAAGSKFRFLREALTVVRGRFDLLVCGHINLLPLAAILDLKIRAPLVLMVYGIDAWQPHPSLLVRRFLRQVDVVWSISEITRDKMAAWSGLAPSKFVVLPNAIHLDQYRPGPKDRDLLNRYGLSGRKVIMMLGRLSASERYKGVDEVLEVMPRLIQREPKLTALVAGDGDDRARLERKALDLGLADRVVFTGFIAEAEKSNYLRLADAFVMPSQGEGFGFVFLEALACGVPVVASKTDGSREAVRHGQLGRLVDPRNPAELKAAILSALRDSPGVPDGLAYFDYPEFQKRIVRSTREAVRG